LSLSKAVWSQGITKIIAFYPLVTVKYIDQDILLAKGISPRAFFNINTPEELQKARAIAGEMEGENNEKG
jgi:molybdopterin-guanine dinucleotide biosynthesis protein A